MSNIDTMPDLPLSPRPNMVTKQGLTSIDSALEAAGVASLPPRLVTGDREVLVKAGARSRILYDVQSDCQSARRKDAFRVVEQPV